jgi:glycosyltransferase involved in cell wall biosynthesis
MERSRKLAYIMPIDLRSRYAHVVNIMQMCQAFHRTGQDVTLIVPRHTGRLDIGSVFDQYAIRDNFAIKFLSVPGMKVGRVNIGELLFGIWAVLYILKEHFDLCYTRVPFYAYINGRLGMATALEIHMPPTSRLDTWALARIVGQITNGEFNRYRIIVISNRLAKILNEQFNLPISRTLVCHDAVDLMPYNKVTSNGNDLRRELGLVNQETLLLTYAGSLYEGRGIELIVELAQRFPQSYFLVVGGDELRIKSYRQKFGGIKNLCFYGYVPHRDVARILKGSDILLMPHGRRATVPGGSNISAYTSPMKMFEYLAAAKPIIASNLPSIVEILRHGQNALIAEPDDTASWSTCLSNLLEDLALRRKLGMTARLTAESNTWDRRSARILEFVLR